MVSPAAISGASVTVKVPKTSTVVVALAVVKPPLAITFIVDPGSDLPDMLNGLLILPLLGETETGSGFPWLGPLPQLPKSFPPNPGGQLQIPCVTVPTGHRYCIVLGFTWAERPSVGATANAEALGDPNFMALPDGGWPTGTRFDCEVPEQAASPAARRTDMPIRQLRK